MDIKQLFDLISNQLQNEMEISRASLKHGVMKGAVTEQVVIEFLNKYLPGGLKVSSGILIDSKGGVSDQLDVIIYDANRTPSLFLREGLRVIPVECAYAVIEVKMLLDAEKLRGCIKNMKSVKKLIRTTYYQQGAVISNATKLYGTEKDYWHETLYFVFSFETKVSARTMCDILLDHAANSDLSKRIDSIFCADLGYLANIKDGKIDALPQLDSKFALVTSNALLIFYACLSHYMNQARIPSFSFVEYVRGMPFEVNLLSPSNSGSSGG